MRLSWNEIRARAATFATDWQDAHYEKGETQSFYEAFFHIFGVKRRSVAVYERKVEKLSGNAGFIDLFWPQVLLVEQKSAGRNLDAARVQAEDYFLSLKENERPRYILACDFQTFELYDLSERTHTHFTLADLPAHVERFGFIMGVQKVAFKDQDPVNIKAAELIGDLHDKLEEAGFTGTDLEKFLVRIVFCLFADDTGVFEKRNMFLEWLDERTAEDGHDLGAKLAELFQTLDTPADKRGRLIDEDIGAFPYVNGDLFKGATRIPAFDSEMREALLTASRFDWSPISPAIFGSLFQSVMDKGERRKAGAHYTTEKNIMKVIGPLFMDGLYAEFEAAKAKKRGKWEALDALQCKIGALDFFDPACGCGNFLIIAYRELRRLEIEILKTAIPNAQLELDAAILSQIDVDQFHGIEIGEFPAEIARAAMWMMDHIMNNELSLAFGQNYARIPLVKSANIVHGDALEIEWSDVVSPAQCDYVFGNPPFIGQSYQSKDQRAQMARIINAKSGRAGSLDYVGAWFLKAGAYVQGQAMRAVPPSDPQGGPPPPVNGWSKERGPRGVAFVSTNSITQGEQVAQLWPLLFERYGLEIAFAHRTFAWGSDARGKAHVHVVIIGLVPRALEPEMKRLFSYPDINDAPEETGHRAISPYLFGANNRVLAHIIVDDMSSPITPRPRMMRGCQSTDFGHYIFREGEIDEFIKLEPASEKYFRSYIGAEEYIKGKRREILFLEQADPRDIRQSVALAERINAVRKDRLKSKKPATRRLAETPTLLEGRTIPSSAFLAIPQTSSERRDYVPFGWIEPPAIPSDKLRFIESATKDQFAILTSAMHMGWMRTVTGRLESRYMYSVGVVYNTFPWPDLSDKARGKLTATGQAILDARENYPEATLADLYDPDAMPADLRKAHRANDLAVDKLYRAKPFESERERVEFLFARYETLRAPLVAAKRGK
jgi:hypothetical protein